MSEFYQPGQHPDAEQLSAFAEDALSVHEREQTLVHLAGCADCRTIVSLALPPVEDVPRLQAPAAHRPWFYGWNVAWLAGAGLVALIFLTVHIRNGGPSGRIAATPTQTAEMRPQAAPTTPPATNAMPSPDLKTSRAAPAPPAPKAVDRFKSPPAVGTISSQEIAELTVQGRNYMVQPQQQQLSQQQMQQQQISPLRGSVGGAIAGTAMGAGVARNDRPPFAQRKSVGEVDEEAAAASGSGRSLEPAAAAAAPAMSAPAAPAKSAPQTSDTITVAAATTEMETTDASVSTVLAPADLANIHRLPRHRAIASTITRANLMLALDTAGALFLSSDGGRHWKAVAAQWPGRAIKVELASLLMLPTKQPASKFIDGNASASDLSSLDLKPPSSPSVAGVVTDSTGAIIPATSIKVADARTGMVRTTTTSGSGHYDVGGLAPDAYRIEAEAPGFETWRGTVILAGAQQSVVNISLKVGAASEAVTVSADTPMVTERAKKAQKDMKAAYSSEPSAAFEITTDSGEVWTSADGKNWKRK